MNIYNKIPRKILMFVYEDSNKNYVTTITKKLNSTYCHLQKTVCMLEKEKFIKSSKDGRKRIITLTKKGVEVVKLFKKIDEVVGKSKGVK